MLPSFSSFHLAPFVPDHAGYDHAWEVSHKGGFPSASNSLFPLPEDSEEVHYITFPIYFFYGKVIY
jgi:hypothetical protein